MGTHMEIFLFLMSVGVPWNGTSLRNILPLETRESYWIMATEVSGFCFPCEKCCCARLPARTGKHCGTRAKSFCEQNRGNVPVMVPSWAEYGNDCTRKEYDKCVRMADPLLTDPHLIFPDNMNDVDHVCRMWSKFVDCIKSYIDRCFTETRRHQFNKAVESSVDSVHQMCTASSYQTEYLQHATCLKSTLTDDAHCGRHYKQLVAQVQGPRDMGRGDLCCSHHRFRECVLSETKRICDVKLTVASKMLASAFSRQILDKAMSFLKEQCLNYIPNRGDCPGYQPSSREEDLYSQSTPTKSIPTQTIETRYLTNDQVFSDNFQPTVDDRATVNPLSWIPGARDGRRKTTKSDFDLGNDFRTTGSSDDVSSRSSYGRGMTWDVTDPAGKDDIFKATHYKPSTESWYPGNNINFHSPEKELNDFSSNQVDEPNQQGLARLDSGSGSLYSRFIIPLASVIASALFLT